jgi:hypothetical protein
MRALWSIPALLFTLLAAGGIISTFDGGGLVDLLISAGLGAAALFFWRKTTAR